jgi:hypothetical protein
MRPESGAYTLLRIALGRAVKAGHVTPNVATLVDPPPKARDEMQPLAADQAAQLLATTKSDRLGLRSNASAFAPVRRDCFHSR